MILSGEDLPQIHRVTEAHLRAVFDETDTDFGQFIVLADEAGGFIQSANQWELSDECERFEEQKKSDPYSLEYHDPTQNKLYAAEGWLTLGEVYNAFLGYLKGSDAWKKTQRWREVPL